MLLEAMDTVPDRVLEPRISVRRVANAKPAAGNRGRTAAPSLPLPALTEPASAGSVEINWQKLLETECMPSAASLQIVSSLR